MLLDWAFFHMLYAFSLHFTPSSSSKHGQGKIGRACYSFNVDNSKLVALNIPEPHKKFISVRSPTTNSTAPTVSKATLPSFPEKWTFLLSGDACKTEAFRASLPQSSSHSAWRPNTRKSYDFTSLDLESGYNLLARHKWITCALLSTLLGFLTDLFTTCASYLSLNSARSALATI